MKQGIMGHCQYLYSGFNNYGLVLETLHLNGTNDQLFKYNQEYLVAESPQRILHEEGHKPPRRLGGEERKVFDAFVKR
jgi:hypothetical protein